MHRNLSPRRLYLLAFLVVALTNAVVLAGVWANRQGAPTALVSLSQRELRLPSARARMRQENSGLALRLDWRTLPAEKDDQGYPGRRQPAWLDAGKLAELGFRPDGYDGREDDRFSWKRPLSREVFVVLEHDGEAYAAAVARAEKALAGAENLFRADPEDKRRAADFERAQQRLERERRTDSRLFAIDAGLEPGRLRQDYQDRNRFIVCRGLVTPGYRFPGQKEPSRGAITRLSVEDIHVPLAHRQAFATMGGKGRAKGNDGQGYRVELAYGSRYEPWIVSVHQGAAGDVRD
ncbi:MAG: DUF4824 family protein [Thermodesulfobacteriota bacterium]